jgi:hypothetical protein
MVGYGALRTDGVCLIPVRAIPIDGVTAVSPPGARGLTRPTYYFSYSPYLPLGLTSRQ